jgi:RNA polymerase sigma-70 factor, ECF subfamily
MKKSETLETIYHVYYKDVFRYVYSLCRHVSTTEDVVQETFYKIYDYIEDLSYEQIKPWLFRIAHNTYIDLYRKEKRQQMYEKSDHPIIQRSAEEEVLVKVAIEHWLNTTNTLTFEQKQLLILRDIQHFTYDEITKITGQSLANVKTKLFRARKIMKDLLERDGQNEM